MRSLLPLLGLTLLGADLPLPKAPLRLVIPDVAAFDKALGGGYRQLLRGELPPEDRVWAAWQKERVGSKLLDQWTKFTGDLPLDWAGLMKLQPRSMALALLAVGHLEAVLVVDTPLTTLPMALPKGVSRAHQGATYQVVTPGAGDASEDPDRRMGLAWARVKTYLILATSERALKLTLDRVLKPEAAPPSLPGLVSLDLDLEALREDRYFSREFPFAAGPEKGLVRAALRQEGTHWVEVREGGPEPRGGVYRFPAPKAALAGWEAQGAPFWATFRRALLEPIPSPASEPVPRLSALPEAGEAPVSDRYTTDFTKRTAALSSAGWEEGDLRPWKELLERTPVTSWGFWVETSGLRRMAFPWPKAQDAAFAELCRATAARRGGRATLVTLGETREVRVGPGLPVLALRRSGDCLWVGPDARSLAQVPTPTMDASLVRWATLDLDAARAEAPRWEKLEGPAQPEQVRPLSDRILGLLGWMPQTTTLSVERRKTPQGWTERVVFGGRS